ncbi:MAG: hypothetical protein AB1942_09330 [Pseudomonadota bacterium]
MPGTARVLFLAGTLLAIAGPAMADEVLSCQGDLVTVQDSTSSFRLTSNPDAQMAAAGALSRSGQPTARLVRRHASLAVAVEGETVRIRPSAQLRAAAATRAEARDGWYDLADARVTEERVTGFAPYGDDRSRRVKLILDRRTGDVRLGGFEGGCKSLPG